MTSTTQSLEPGVYHDIPFDEYLSWDAVSASFMKQFDHTPHYAQFMATQPDEEKACYAKGRLFHMLSLEPHKADDGFIVRPATYVNDDGEEKHWHGGAKACKAWAASHSDRTIIDNAVFAEAAGMAARVRQLKQMQPFLADAKVELSMVWTDELTGLLCKGRCDAYKNGICVDLKSTSGAAGHKAFFQECQQHKYYLQAAHYIEGMKALGMTVADVPAWFCFVAVEGYPPFDLQCFDVQDDPSAMSYDFLQYGRLKRSMILQQIRYCKEKGVWPGYREESTDMELCFTARKEFEELTGGLTNG